MTVEQFIDQYIISGIVGSGSFPINIQVTDADWKRLAVRFPSEIDSTTSPPCIRLCQQGVRINPTVSGSAGQASLLDLSASDVL